MIRKCSASLIVILSLLAMQGMAAQEKSDFEGIAGWQRFLFGVPGYPQLAIGQKEGWYYLGFGLPNIVAGTALQSAYLAGPRSPENEWKLGIGTLAGEIGLSLQGYSLWAYERDRQDAMGEGLRTGRESYLALLSAPYSGPALDWRCLPILGLEIAAAMDEDWYDRIGAFFSKPTATFWGRSMGRTEALGLELAWALSANLFVAVAEESIFRGVIQDRLGPVWESLFFGAMHLGNAFFAKPGDRTALRDAVVQSLFASVAGYYLSCLAVEKGGDLRTGIAYHYWHNVVAMVLDYLYEEGKKAGAEGIASASPVRDAGPEILLAWDVGGPSLTLRARLD